MRTIRRHIIHASATPNDRNVTAKDIDLWHKKRGWSGIGYHFVVLRDGTLQAGRPLEKIGAHVSGHNKDSIGTCLIGAGLSLSDFTLAQIRALRELDATLKRTFKGMTTHGHREYANKSCPGFNIKDFPWEEPAPTPVPLQKELTWWGRLMQSLGRKKGY